MTTFRHFTDIVLCAGLLLVVIRAINGSNILQDCENGQLCADFNNIGQEVSTMNGVSVLSNITSSFTNKCSRQAVFQVKFNVIDKEPFPPQCQREYSYKQMLKVELLLSSTSRSGWQFNIGDSSTNGYGGDSGDSDLAAEIQGLNGNASAWASCFEDQIKPDCRCKSLWNAEVLGSGVGKVTFYIGDNIFYMINDAGDVKRMCDKCLYALDGRNDYRAGNVPGDTKIYVAINRVVRYRFDRTGYGVCGLKMSWVEDGIPCVSSTNKMYEHGYEFDDDCNKCQCVNGHIQCTNNDCQKECVDDCASMANGDYQSCQGCNVYVTCSNGLTYDNRPCPANLVWDDKKKRCEYTSTTCGIISIPDCISDCSNVPNGNYQSCNGCNVYASCSNGHIFDNRPCATGLVWDDGKKQCQSESTTCDSSCTTSAGKKIENGGTFTKECNQCQCNYGTIDCTTKVCPDCVTDCANKASGYYQSCLGCNLYVTCSNGLTYDKRECPPPLVWNNKRKVCDWTSDTCGCVADCTGVPDGFYQSCQGCDVFVVCRSGMMFDNQPCQLYRKWDDVIKQCVPYSRTCYH